MMTKNSIEKVPYGEEQTPTLDFRSGDLKKAMRLQVQAACELFQRIDLETVARISHRMNSIRTTGNSIYILGNGGSAATALHMANDLTMAVSDDSLKEPFKITCLNGNLSLFSALANDIGYDQVFLRQLQTLLEEGDVVIGISVSGNSPNCVKALEYAQRRRATTIGLLGCDGGAMMQVSDYCLHVASNDYYIVENVHLAISHLLAYCLRSR
jgi:D-sedoheptulose 7-phosphate isomerase